MYLRSVTERIRNKRIRKEALVVLSRQSKKILQGVRFDVFFLSLG